MDDYYTVVIQPCFMFLVSLRTKNCILPSNRFKKPDLSERDTRSNHCLALCLNDSLSLLTNDT